MSVRTDTSRGTYIPVSTVEIAKTKKCSLSETCSGIFRKLLCCCTPLKDSAPMVSIIPSLDIEVLRYQEIVKKEGEVAHVKAFKSGEIDFPVSEEEEYRLYLAEQQRLSEAATLERYGKDKVRLYLENSEQTKK